MHTAKLQFGKAKKEGKMQCYCCAQERCYLMLCFSLTIVALLLTGCASVPKQPAKSILVYDVRKIACTPPAMLPIQTPLRTENARRLLEIESRIENASGVRIGNFYIAEQSELNAFISEKDGTNMLVINRPLLVKLGNDDAAIAALIGHELAHVALGHLSTKKGIAQTIGMGGQVIGLIASAFIPGGGLLVSAGGQAITQAYSRNHERDADEVGIDYSVKAGYEPSGALRLFAALPARGDGTSGFFDSHPGKIERIDHLQEVIRQKYGGASRR